MVGRILNGGKEIIKRTLQTKMLPVFYLLMLIPSTVHARASAQRVMRYMHVLFISYCSHNNAGRSLIPPQIWPLSFTNSRVVFHLRNV